MIATAQLGIGRKHAKWQGAIVGYKNKVNIHISQDLKNPEEVYNKCPKKVFSLENNKLKVVNPLECNLCRECEEVSEGKVRIEVIENSFIVNIESACGLSVEEVILQSLKVLKKKVKEFERKLEKLK